jgi:hypothetical protein
VGPRVGLDRFERNISYIFRESNPDLFAVKRYLVFRFIIPVVFRYIKNTSVCNCSVCDVELHYIVQSSPVPWYGRRCRIVCDVI